MITTVRITSDEEKYLCHPENREGTFINGVSPLEWLRRNAGKPVHIETKPFKDGGCLTWPVVPDELFEAIREGEPWRPFVCEHVIDVD